MSEAKRARAYEATRTILFIDEIHRFNKAQQDAFLPHVEQGTVTLIGATTENPSFAVNAALLSRCKVFHLEPLADADVVRLLRRALQDETRLSRSK
jgi:putative ATPase